MTSEDVEFSVEDDEVVIEADTEDPIRLHIHYHYRDFDEDSLMVRKHETGYRVGYLCQDEDCSSPEEGDGVGYIGTCLRSDGGILHKRFQEALGLNSSWEKLASMDDVLYETACRVWPNRVDKEPQELLRDSEGEIERDNIKLPYRGAWDKTIEWYEHNGYFGDPDRVMLSVYQHGGRAYSVGDGRNFPDFKWDVSSYGAVWVPDKHLRDEEAKGLTGKKRHAKMVEWASQAVEVMNDWCNGNCYGVIVQYFDLEGNPANVVGFMDSTRSWKDDEDACWGYVGRKWAEEELERQMKWEPNKEVA